MEKLLYICYALLYSLKSKTSNPLNVSGNGMGEKEGEKSGDRTHVDKLSSSVLLRLESAIQIKNI